MHKYNKIHQDIMQNSQNIERRINRCSFCRRAGHNRLTCDDERLLDFESICADKCQRMQEIEFYDWLSETYEANNSDLLKTYAAKKSRIPFNNIRDISIYKDAITRYIYETYKYQYNMPATEEASDNDSMPDLIEINDDYFLEVETINTLTGLRNINEEDYQNIMNASLENDIRSAYFFAGMFRSSMSARLETPLHSRKFVIESILQEEDKMEKIEEIVDCCICFESYNKSEFVKLNCNHEFCNGCLKNALTSDKRPKPCCAYCRTEVTRMISRTYEIYDKMRELIL